MDNINDLVNAAMEQWDEETNCGETDPAFAGEVGKEIDNLVYGLNQEKIERLLSDTSPIIFESCTYSGKVVHERGPREFTIFWPPNGKEKPKQPEPAPVTFIKCVCGNNIFLQGKMLAPGVNKPAVLKAVWVCVGCGMKYMPDDFPKKGEEESRRESKLILPDSRKLRAVT